MGEMEMFSPTGAWGAHRSNVQALLEGESKIIGIETPEDRNIRRKEKERKKTALEIWMHQMP